MIYLVVDPSLGNSYCFDKVSEALKGGISYIQIWNHWLPQQDRVAFCKTIHSLAHVYRVPVLINENWKLVKEAKLDGVHFDKIPQQLDEINKQIGRSFLIGITCGNDLAPLEWANNHKIDYISFCSMFPSISAGKCEIVSNETIQRAKELTDIPIFLSGGINMANVASLRDYNIEGIALISGIMKAENATVATQTYKDKFLKK